MGIISPDELKKLTPEEKKEYEFLENQINKDLLEANSFCYSVYLQNEALPSERVRKKINEEAIKSGWDKVTIEEDEDRGKYYLKFWIKEKE
jgi:hypothetical protein